MAFVVASWFDNNHQQAAQVYNVPDGQSISVTFEQGGEAEEITLTGDTLKGFKAGVIVLTNIFGALPFARVHLNPDNGTPTNEDAPTINKDGDVVPTTND